MSDYVIIGNGTAAAGCIEGIRSIDSEGKITLISKEKYKVYSRPLISYLLEGKTDVERMKYRGEDFYEKNNVSFLPGISATKIDADKKEISLDISILTNSFLIEFMYRKHSISFPFKASSFSV